MPPLRFVFGRRAASPSADVGRAPSPGVDIVLMSMAREEDRKAVVTLASRCRTGDSDPAGQFAPAGLLAELGGRPGRDVYAWTAWPTGTAGAWGDDGPLGLAALVAAGAMPQARFSIAWLLVRPDVRRRGIATALVSHAAAHAESLGATRVHAETLASWPAAAGFWQRVGLQQPS